MPRVPPELNLKIGPFSVSAKGVEAVRAIRWPVAFAVALLVPVLAYPVQVCYDLFCGGGGLSLGLSNGAYRDARVREWIGGFY
jgi:hypothetical protein